MGIKNTSEINTIGDAYPVTGIYWYGALIDQTRYNHCSFFLYDVNE